MAVVLLIIIDSNCVDCGYPCRHEACIYYKVIRYICDNCKEEQDDLYVFDGQELCAECILKQLEKVEYDDWE